MAQTEPIVTRFGFPDGAVMASSEPTTYWPVSQPLKPADCDHSAWLLTKSDIEVYQFYFQQTQVR